MWKIAWLVGAFLWAASGIHSLIEGDLEAMKSSLALGILSLIAVEVL